MDEEEMHCGSIHSKLCLLLIAICSINEGNNKYYHVLLFIKGDPEIPDY